jgi:hypothetical protein
MTRQRSKRRKSRSRRRASHARRRALAVRLLFGSIRLCGLAVRTCWRIARDPSLAVTLAAMEMRGARDATSRRIRKALHLKPRRHAKRRAKLGWSLARPTLDFPGPGVAVFSVVVGLCLAVGFGAVVRPTYRIGSASGADLPALPVIGARFDGMTLADRLGDSGIEDGHRDDLLSSPLLADPEFARAVHWWVQYWRVSARGWFPGFLERMESHGPMVDAELAARGLPPSLRYLPLIESGYDPRVTSRASAVGLWQLMPETAEDYGLEMGPLIDERRNPFKSTDAALRYLDRLRDQFGSWHLALAAYNWGPTRVRRILRRYAPGEAGSDLLYWRLRDRFPQETADFLPKLYGAMWVASRPESYGYAAPEAELFAFDSVAVSGLTSLDVVALATGVPFEEVVLLNPEYLRAVTPPGRAASIRVPPGRGPRFEEIYPRLTAEQRVTAVQHVVESGETLSEIAERYGVDSEHIDAVNPDVGPRDLRAGERLVVPVSPSVRGDSSR